MESEVERFHRHPKREKLTKCVEFPSIFPEELITEIISRLPVKSLLKFMSVSKSWLSLISSPEFINTHLTVYNNNDQRHHRLMLGFSMHCYKLRECSFSSLFCNPVIELSDFNYPMKVEYDEGFSPVGSINGLICLVHGYHSPKHLFLWNPSIRKYKKFSNSRPKFRYDACMYGFGYDELHDDYKIVGIFCIYGRSLHIDFKIYSLKGDSWRMIPYSHGGMCFSRRSVFVNGKLHWTTHSFDQSVCKGGGIVSFSLAYENWGKVEEPCYGGKESISDLGVFGNDFCGFSHHLAIGVDVWVMKDYGIKESWTKMCTITYQKLERDIYFPSVFLSNNGDVLVGYGSMFILYNPKDDSFKYPKVINYSEWQIGEIYIESLISPLST